MFMINRITICIQKVQVVDISKAITLQIFEDFSLFWDFCSTKHSKICAKPLSGSAKISAKGSVSSIVQRRDNFNSCLAINLAFIKTLLLLKNTLIHVCALKNLFSLFFVVSNPLTTNAPRHIETIQLIYNANQLTGFYIMGDIGR